MGPSAAQEFVHIVFEQSQAPTETGKVLMFQAVGAAIVRTVDVHPNLVAMMEVLERRFGDPGDVVLDNSRLFLEGLAQEPEAVQRVLVEPMLMH